jgi:hypothetical protein
MITTNVISITFRSGATQSIVCLNAIEAQRIYVEILQVMGAALTGEAPPLVAVEDDSTAIALNTLEIAGLALGEHASARIEQAPRKERPRPVPVPMPARAPGERSTLIAN